MRYIILISAFICLFFSCKKKDTFGYTCTCNSRSTGQLDTTFSIRAEAVGIANYDCNDYEDTSNKYGADIVCDIE